MYVSQLVSDTRVFRFCKSEGIYRTQPRKSTRVVAAQRSKACFARSITDSATALVVILARSSAITRPSNLA
jgi:hypothetical protein